MNNVNVDAAMACSCCLFPGRQQGFDNSSTRKVRFEAGSGDSEGTMGLKQPEYSLPLGWVAAHL